MHINRHRIDIKVHETEDFPPRVSGNYKSWGCEIHSRPSRKAAEIPLQTQDDGSLLGLAHRVWVHFLSLSMLSVLLAVPAQIAASSQADSLKQTKRCLSSVTRGILRLGLGSQTPVSSASIHHQHHNSPASHSLPLPLLWVPGEPIPQGSSKGLARTSFVQGPQAPWPASYSVRFEPDSFTWQLCLATASCFLFPLLKSIGKNLLIRDLQPAVIWRQTRTRQAPISHRLSPESFQFLMLT